MSVNKSRRIQTSFTPLLNWPCFKSYLWQRGWGNMYFRQFHPYSFSFILSYFKPKLKTYFQAWNSDCPENQHSKSLTCLSGCISSSSSRNGWCRLRENWERKAMRRRNIGNTASIGREDGKPEEAQAIYIKASYRFLFVEAQTLLNQTPYSSRIIFIVVVNGDGGVGVGASAVVVVVVVVNPFLLLYVLTITFSHFIIVFALPYSPSAPNTLLLYIFLSFHPYLFLPLRLLAPLPLPPSFSPYLDYKL